MKMKESPRVMYNHAWGFLYGGNLTNSGNRIGSFK